MPRLRISTALVFIAVIAAWFATAQLPDGIGIELRIAGRCLLFAIPVLGAIHYRATMQAFWIGCCVVILFNLSPLKPQFEHISYLVQDALTPDPSSPMHSFMRQTIQTGCIVILAVLCGLLSALIYRHAQRALQVPRRTVEVKNEPEH